MGVSRPCHWDRRSGVSPVPRWCVLAIRVHPARETARTEAPAMVQSFTTPDDKPLVEPDGKRRRRVLVTGAAGNIGAYFAEQAKDKYDLRLMVREEGDAKAIRT